MNYHLKKQQRLKSANFHELWFQCLVFVSAILFLFSPEENEAKVIEICLLSNARKVRRQKLLDELTKTLAPPGVALLKRVWNSFEDKLDAIRGTDHDC